MAYRPVSGKELARLASLSVPSADETRATVLAAHAAGITYGEIAAAIHAPLRTVHAWAYGRSSPGAAVRFFVCAVLEVATAERKRANKRHRQYERRKAKGKAEAVPETAILPSDTPPAPPNSVTTDES